MNYHLKYHAGTGDAVVQKNFPEPGFYFKSDMWGLRGV